jgi:undecaprenyl-diphosphatase
MSSRFNHDPEKLSHRVAYGSAFFLVGILILLTHLALSGSLLGIDLSIMKCIYQTRTPELTTAMNLVSLLGEQVVLIASVAICTVLLLKKRWRDLWLYILLVGGSEALNLTLKKIISRPRPALLTLVRETNFSFPSGHATASVVFYGTISYWLWRSSKNKQLGRLGLTAATLIILAVGYSRIYLGAHFPSDVLGGYLAGLAWLCIILG